jgi:hypothetical protein
MQCPECKGVKMIQSGAGSGIGVALSQCPTCGGTGVLYTQAEMDELKYEITRLKTKDREIETLNKIARKLVSEISKLWPRVYFSIEKCDYCAFHEIFDDCLDQCNEPNKDCERGIIEWVRRQVEEDVKK